MASQVELVVGTRLVPGEKDFIGVIAYDRHMYAQPCTVVREATREEYLAQYKYPSVAEKLISNSEDVRFYEIHTD